MRITSGKVVAGKVIVEDDSLPEGTTVTVLAPDGTEEFELSPADEEALLAAIDEAGRNETIPAKDILSTLKSGS